MGYDSITSLLITKGILISLFHQTKKQNIRLHGIDTVFAASSSLLFPQQSALLMFNGSSLAAASKPARDAALGFGGAFFHFLVKLVDGF